MSKKIADTRRILLIGNPNAGKSLLFNALTGKTAKVANFPGVTVEHKSGVLKGSQNLQITDLPGIYSLKARSQDEKITTRAVSDILQGAGPKDTVVAVVDATQLQKSLYLVAELEQSGRLGALVITMADLISRHLQLEITRKLSKRVQLPIFIVSATKMTGIEELKSFLVSSISSTKQPVAKKKNEAGPIGLLDQVAFDIESIEERHERVSKWLLGLELKRTRSSKIAAQIDKVALHPILGPAFLVLVFAILFEALFVGARPIVAGIEQVNSWAAVFTHSLFDKNSLLASLLADGIISGVGSVLSFVPLIAILFLFLGALEDSGYMARAVFLLHRVMSRVGLSGRAFVPLVSGFSCSVPAILSTRIIESRSERLITIMVTPLVSCAARLPIYTLLIAAVFSQMPPLLGFFDMGAVIMVSIYIFGIVLVFSIAAILRRGFLGEKRVPLIMELPQYRWPRPSSLWFTVKSRVRIFIKDVGTVILALTIVLWALFTFPLDKENHQTNPAQSADVAQLLPFGKISTSHLEHSYAGQLGHLIEPLIEPLGFNWKIGVGLIASFAAREVFISTFGVIYGLSDASDEPLSLSQAMRNDINPKTGLPVYRPLVALSLLIFFAVALQCMSTVAATRKETKSWRWPLFQLGYLNTLAWLLSFTLFQSGKALGF